MASTSPINGHSTMAEPITPTPPQITAIGPILAIAAPTRPPTNAWLLLDGMQNRQVAMFQVMALPSAPKITSGPPDGSANQHLL